MDNQRLQKMLERLGLLETLKVKGVISETEWKAAKAKVEAQVKTELETDL